MTAIPANRLELFVAELLAKGGFMPDEAKAIAVSLTLSELFGHGSHGLMRVAEYLKDLKHGVTISGANLQIIQETPSSILADGQFGAGQVMMPQLLAKLRAKIETQAVVTASMRNSGHIGRIGEWVEGAARDGFPSLLLVNDNGNSLHVAPPGGKQAVTSTNPMAFAIPLPDGEIFMTDMSTSALAFGKVKLARLSGGVVPPGTIQDAAGQPTTDPEALFSDPRGTMLPMGGADSYKGFALSMFVDLMTAGLSGGQTPPAAEGIVYANNLTITLWNPKFFAGLGHMQQQAKKYIEFVRGSAPIDRAKPIRLAGDRMNSVKRERERNGIPLNKGLAENLLTLAKNLGVKPLPELTKI